jgi:hypothetical protein
LTLLNITSSHLLLHRLAELMLDKKQHQLSLDDLSKDEHIGDFVKSIQIDSPYQQLLFEGTLDFMVCGFWCNDTGIHGFSVETKPYCFRLDNYDGNNAFGFERIGSIDPRMGFSVRCLKV